MFSLFKRITAFSMRDELSSYSEISRMGLWDSQETAISINKLQG